MKPCSLLYKFIFVSIFLSFFNSVFAGTLSGTLTNYDTSATLEDVRVVLLRSDDPNWAGEHAWIYVGETTSDAAGDYQFTALAERQYRVHIDTGTTDIIGTHYVDADLYHVQVFTAADTTDMDIALREAGLIWGYVRNSLADPIPYAQVVVRGAWTRDASSWHQVSTDATGLYSAWVLPSPAEFYRLFVIQASLGATQYGAQWAPDLYQATLGAGVHGHDFVLAEGGCVEGSVTNEAAVGLENVGVRANVGLIEELPDWTAVDGSYQINSVPTTPSAYVSINLYNPVQLGGVKYASGEQFLGPFVIGASPVCISVPAMEPPVAGGVEGVITDQGGTPIVGVEIQIEGYDADGNSANEIDDVYTDAFGQYTLDYVPPGTYTVRATKDDWVMKVKQDVVVSSGSFTDVDLTLTSAANGAVVSGAIAGFAANTCHNTTSGVLLPSYVENLCETGILAFPGAYPYRKQDFIEITRLFLGMTEIEDGYADYFETEPSETVGNYDMALPAGSIDGVYYSYYEVEEGDYVLFHGKQSWLLSAGETLAGADFTLAPATDVGTLTGNISVPAGEQLNPHQTMIYAVPEDWPPVSVFGDALAMLDFAPVYKIDNLPAGTYRVNAITDGLVDQSYPGVVVSSGATTNLDINFTLGSSLIGNVTDAATSLPIEDARIEINQTGVYDLSNSSGDYAISGIATGTYDIHASKPGYGDFSASQFVAGASVTLNIVMDSTVGTIAGHVVDDTATAIDGATVVAYNPALDSFELATTVAGDFLIGDLPAGDYVLGIDAAGYDVTVYPPSGTLSLSPHQNLVIPADIVVSASPPELTSRSTVSESGGITTLLVNVMSDQDLLSDLVISTEGLVTTDGCSSFSRLTISVREVRLTCVVEPTETLVLIHVEEGSLPVIPGNPASISFSYEVATNLISNSTTNFTNAMGGTSTIMGTQDNTQVYVPPFSLTGASTTAATLVVQRYGNPGDAVTGTSHASASAVYDFSFIDGVEIAANHFATITMQFELPVGTTQAEFEATLRIGYFNVQDQAWVYDDDPDSGISNIHINWLNNTITFDVTHFSRFAAFLPSEDDTPPEVACLEGTNPGGKNVPKAGQKSRGQNEDGFYQLIAIDDNDPAPQIFVSDINGSGPFGPFSSGDTVKITEAPGSKAVSKPMAGVVVAHIRLTADALVTATDAAGNATSVSCLVPPPPK